MSSLNTCKQAVQQLKTLSDPERARKSQRFFKTGKGEYAEGDRFLGVAVPALRSLTPKADAMSLSECELLLNSEYHEARLLALFILVRQFGKSGADTREKIVAVYLANTDAVNNWDLVDSSAYQILGRHLQHRSPEILYQLAEASSLWERRIAIVATYWFIKQGDFSDTLGIAKILLEDEQDLIQKAVGWMLREVGNRDGAVERTFLNQHYQRMPRTMLRYAIEKFPNEERQQYLTGQI